MLIERFLQFIENKNYSLAKVEKELGLANGYLGKMKARNGSIGSNIIEKIVYAYPEIDVNWLITGRPLSVVNIERADTGSRHNGIPYYETLLATAGDFISLLNDAVPKLYYNIPQFDDCKALIPVYGHSMKGIVEPGDLIAIAEINNRDEFNPQRPYLVITEDNRMIKYLREDENDSSIIWAESTNHARIKLHVDNIKKIYAIKGIVRIY